MPLDIVFDSQHTLFIDSDNANALNIEPESSWFSPSYWQSKNAVVRTAQGRGTTYFVKHKQYTLVLRQYLRGGVIRHLSNNQFIYTGHKRSRPWLELSLLSNMQKQGLPVPIGIAATIQKQGATYSAAILTVCIEGAKSLHQQLSNNAITQRQWQAIGKLVKHFHQQQIYHSDLNVHNVLFDSEQSLWLIDFDKCSERPGNYWKSKNLQRFYRSLLKQQALAEVYHFNQQNWLALQQGYNL